MKTFFLDLPRDRHVRLPEGERYRVQCLAGLIWITTGDDLRDHVLRPGESREFAGHSLVVGALRESRIAWVGEAAGSHANFPAWRGRLAVFWRRVWFRPGSLL